jgi:heme/copper-type cytochrome/quinol oxidase subunit 1
MTMTETRPNATSDVALGHGGEPSATTSVPAPLNWLTTADHSRVGRLFVVSALAFAAAMTVLAVLAAFERITPGSFDLFAGVNDATHVNNLAVWGVMFLGVLPLLAGLALAVVPLQVGSRTVAFGRAAAFGFWTWLVGAGLMVGSVIADGGPGGADHDTVDLYLLALGLVCVGLVVAAVCVATTVLTLRAPGMRLDRVPLFAWSAMVQSVMVVVMLPVLIGHLIFQYVDHRYGKIAFGGDSPITPYLQWMVRQPSTGLMMIPALGIVAEIVPVFARNRQRLTGVLQGAIAVAGLASFGAFAQDRLFGNVTTQLTFILVSLLAVVGPLLVLAVNGLTLKTGKPVVKAPLVWAMLLGLGALAAAAMQVLPPFRDLELQGTAYENGQFYAAAGVGLLAGIAGLIYWGPKLWGRVIPDKPAMGLALLGLLGVALTAIPAAVAGFIDQPRDSVLFSKDDATGALNTLVMVGHAIVALVILSSLSLLARCALSKRSTEAGDDPWEGHTLEWSTSSPPQPGNFTGPLPVVSSDRPLLDAREVS